MKAIELPRGWQQLKKRDIMPSGKTRWEVIYNENKEEITPGTIYNFPNGPAQYVYKTNHALWASYVFEDIVLGTAQVSSFSVPSESELMDILREVKKLIHNSQGIYGYRHDGITHTPWYNLGCINELIEYMEKA